MSKKPVKKTVSRVQVKKSKTQTDTWDPIWGKIPAKKKASEIWDKVPTEGPVYKALSGPDRNNVLDTMMKVEVNKGAQKIMGDYFRKYGYVKEDGIVLKELKSLKRAMKKRMHRGKNMQIGAEMENEGMKACIYIVEKRIKKEQSKK